MLFVCLLFDKSRQCHIREVDVKRSVKRKAYRNRQRRVRIRRSIKFGKTSLLPEANMRSEIKIEQWEKRLTERLGNNCCSKKETRRKRPYQRPGNHVVQPLPFAYISMDIPRATTQTPNDHKRGTQTPCIP